MKYLLAALTLLLALPLQAARDLNRNRSQSPTWLDPAKAAKEDPDFLIQGEYFKEGASHAAQVVALGNGNFEIYVLKGGLPGAGYEHEKRGGRFRIITENKVSTFEEKNTKIKASLGQGELTLDIEGEASLVLPRIERKSPTLGAKPPKEGVVLFDGTSVDGWEGGALENGLLKISGLKTRGAFSKEKFKSYHAHIEFQTPYKPEARGQGRGSSGVYHHGRWETQVLDSFGLAGKQNECGGIYSITEPRLNMCLPPLTWQTYDVDFTAAKFDEDGNRIAWPRITVKLNGVLIHDDVELNKDKTAAAPFGSEIKDEPGPIFLHDHGNPVYFRNIWVLPK